MLEALPTSWTSERSTSAWLGRLVERSSTASPSTGTSRVAVAPRARRKGTKVRNFMVDYGGIRDGDGSIQTRLTNLLESV